MSANNMLVDIKFEEVNVDSFRTAANDILEQVNHLSKTIDDFRNYFRPNKEKESIIVEDVINDALSIVNKVLYNNGIDVICLFSETSSVSLYKRELIQVLINIINNAKESMLETSKSEKKLIIKIHESFDKIIIEICDNGVGIDEKTGTGLGLFMSKTIMEKHLNDEITVTNNETGGACFILNIYK